MAKSKEQTIQWPKVKNRQCNDQKKKNKRMNNDLQTNTQKTKDCVRQILLESKGELGCSGRINSSCLTNGTRRRATLVTLLLVLKTNI
jgi:hypothetical protein